ncbi:MAG: glycosyltransferase family 4 protein [Candidatus Kerfeldbacteria bacterium]|nr:glycosyltransferase family 4 protein [Candidatus Kerfeldbacteria bacterium]
MRIGIDIRPLLDPTPSGVGEYTEQIVRSLIRLGSDHEFVLFANAFRADEGKLRLRLDGPRVTWCIRHIPNRLLHGSLWSIRRPALDSFTGPVDCFFMPNWHFAAFSAAVRRRVLTVHDVTYRRHPQYYSFRRRLWHRLIRADGLIRSADALLAVSEHTKRELMALFAVPEQRITVTPLAPSALFATVVSHAERAAVRQRYRLPAHYGLILATQEPRKNIEGALMAFDLFAQRYPASDLGIVVAGAAGWQMGALRRRVSTLVSRARIHFLGYVPSDVRPALYAGSVFFLSPSFAEGFGLPLLEAASQGVPVITSARSAMPSVLGGGALLVDPHDLEQLVEAMEELLADDALRQRLVRAGHDRVSQYSWERTAATTLAVLTGEQP